MGFRFRKSINLGGGFRINISKSGIGYSWGVKGYRITKTARGTIRHTASLPGTGLSYVEETGRRRKQPVSQLQVNPNVYDTESIQNANADGMVSSGTEDILRLAKRVIRINRLSTFGIIVFLILGCNYEIFILPFLLFFALKIYAKTKGRIRLEYDIDEDQVETVKRRTEPMLKVIECDKVWRITETNRVIDSRYTAGAGKTLNRVLCKTSRKLPYPFLSNLPAACIKSGNERLVFLPDKLLVFQKSKIGALNYNDLDVKIHTTRFIEDGVVPKDATTVGETWRFVNNNGTPDKRFSNNRKLPICLYGEIELKSSSGLNTIIMFSNFKLFDQVQPTDVKEEKFPPITAKDIVSIHTESIDVDAEVETPEGAEISYLDAKALKFWNKKRTDFQIPQYYKNTDFGRNVGPALRRLLEGGYLELGSLEQRVSLKTVPELKAILADKELKASGKKAELVQRILDNFDPDEVEEIFPVNVYQITDKGRAALDPYSIVEESKEHLLDFPYYRLINEKQKHPDEENKVIITRMLSEDIQKCYQNQDRSQYELVMSKTARYLHEVGEQVSAFECYSLAFFVRSVELSNAGFTGDDEFAYRLALGIDRSGQMCEYEIEEMISNFTHAVQKNHPFSLNSEENINQAISRLKKILKLK